MFEPIVHSLLTTIEIALQFHVVSCFIKFRIWMLLQMTIDNMPSLWDSHVYWIIQHGLRKSLHIIHLTRLKA